MEKAPIAPPQILKLDHPKLAVTPAVLGPATAMVLDPARAVDTAAA